MVQSKAGTVEEYLEELPEERSGREWSRPSSG
jgi:hypothetical protein